MQQLNRDVLLEAYEQGRRDFRRVAAIAINLFEADLRWVDLSGSCLDQLYMPYGNLSMAKLQNISLAQAQLADSILYRADLTAAHLKGVNLSRADLRNTHLKGAQLDNSDLSGANLSGADLTGASLEGCKLIGARLEGTILQDTNLSRCNLFRAIGVELSGCYCDSGTILPNGYHYGL